MNAANDLAGLCKPQGKFLLFVQPASHPLFLGYLLAPGLTSSPSIFLGFPSFNTAMPVFKGKFSGHLLAIHNSNSGFDRKKKKTCSLRKPEGRNVSKTCEKFGMDLFPFLALERTLRRVEKLITAFICYNAHT